LTVTGSIQLGSWVDETSPANYFAGDGINDRVVILVPEGGSSFTQAGGTLASTGVKGASFDTAAPYFRLVVQATDFEFDNDNNNVIELDSVTLSLGVSPFTLTNGSFESDSTDVGTGAAPTSWIQIPAEGVSKNILTNGAKIYNQTTKLEDITIVSTAFAGTKVMKVYGQNYYPGGVWEGPSQTGTVYQEFPVNTTPSLTVGATIHARGMAKVFSIDPLTSNSTFNYGFKYLGADNQEIGRQITSLTSANFTPDIWAPLTVSGTVPVGTAKVQLISEFIQTSSAGNGAVYLDDLSIGFGAIIPTATVGANTYSLVWSDEFDGTALNTANWTPETGGGGWGNNEQQTYTSDSANLRVDSGNLIIQAVKSGSSWTSARIKSQDKRLFRYGKIEFRAKLPTGVGPWPAAWMMGNNISSVGWPDCGEIDVLEWRGGFNGVATSDANTVGHALHSATRNGGNPVEAPRSAVSNPSSQFHTYAVVWTSSGMTFIVDGVNKATLTPPTADAAAFQKEFFLILNLAMGGGYLGTINTISPSVTSATYEVDYVRVYQDATVTTPAPSAPATPTFSSISSTGFTVNWTPVSGATSYKLDVSTSSTFGAGTYLSQAQDLTVSGTSQAITGLTPSTTYYARVRAVNAGGTSVSSPYGTLTSYQQYLAGLGLDTSVAFNADANADGIPEGIKYAFNAASPQLGTSPATIIRSGSTLTYTFDIKSDTALSIVAEYSTDLTSWIPQNSSVITNGTGAAIGYTRKIVTITTSSPQPTKAFIRLKVTGN
jgi:beta-glucanase (GH16 family)/cyclophilin family peptidyl-prolyl cis-trans isomerase